MKAKVAIVGGGVMGTSIALECARRIEDPLRDPVVLLERDHIGSGSSGRSGAILRTIYSDKPLVAMARESLRTYATFQALTGRPIGFRRTGVLTLVGPDQRDWQARLESNVAGMRELGTVVELVEAERIRELLPGIQVRPGSRAAWEPEAGTVDPRLTLEAFAGLARSHGASTRLATAAEEILVEGGRVTGVRTSRGEVRAESVVIVAGPWTRRLLAPLGIDLPLEVVRPENHFFTRPHADVGEVEEDYDGRSSGTMGFDMSEQIDRMIEAAEEVVAPGMHPVLIDLENSFYARCENEPPTTRVGRVDYNEDQVLDDPDDLVEDVPDEARAWARERLLERLPAYAEQSEAGSQAAWYTLTPDSQPILGRAPGVEGLFLAAGFSGHGFKLGPSVGVGMAQMVFGEAVNAFEPEFFAPERFAASSSTATSGAFGL